MGYIFRQKGRNRQNRARPFYWPGWLVEMRGNRRQMLLLALALCALDRPGFDYALGRIAAQFRGGPGQNGTALYEEFKRLNQDRFEALRPKPVM